LSRNNITDLSVSLLVMVLFLGCNRIDNNQIVAQVNNDMLTIDVLHALVPDFSQLDSLQKAQYVENWIQETLLKQAAEKILLDRDPLFNQQVETYRRRLLADKMMQKYMNESAVVSEQEIRNYYDAHQESFKRNEDEVFALHVLLPTLDEARELRKILRDNDLDKKAVVLRKYQNETGLFKLGDLIPEIRNRLAQSREVDVFGPINTDYGYHIMNVTQWYSKDSMRPLEEVWDEIAGRLSIDKQMDVRLARIDALRAQANVSFHPSLFTQESK